MTSNKLLSTMLGSAVVVFGTTRIAVDGDGCPDHTNLSACMSDFSCEWIDGVCWDYFDGCLAYRYESACNADMDCEWKNGACRDYEPFPAPGPGSIPGDAIIDGCVGYWYESACTADMDCEWKDGACQDYEDWDTCAPLAEEDCSEAVECWWNSGSCLHDGIIPCVMVESTTDCWPLMPNPEAGEVQIPMEFCTCVEGLDTSSCDQASVEKLESHVRTCREMAGGSSDGWVNTNQGRVKGKRTDHWTGYMNIPYAQPPIGENRFMPPITTPLPRFPITGLDDDRDIKCWGTGGQAGTEDCLVLHVFTPKDHDVNGDEKLPVAVHIYGGGYMTGTAVKNPHEGFMDGIILVTFNYRMGALGFLTNDEISADVKARGGIDSTGSVNGLLDQLAVLEWVQSQIHHFGGDRNQVTLMGQSAGAFSVCHFALSERARGLFHRAIAMSGWCVGDSPLSSIKTASKAKEMSANLLGELGFAGKTLNELREVPAEELVYENGYWTGITAMPAYDGYLLPLIKLQSHPMWLPSNQIMMGFNTLDIGADNAWLRPFGAPDAWPTELTEEQADERLRTIFDEQQLAIVKGKLAGLNPLRKVQVVSSFSTFPCDMITMANEYRDVKFYVQGFDYDGKERVAPLTQNAPMTIGWAVHAGESLNLWADSLAYAIMPLTDPHVMAEMQTDFSSFIAMGPAGVPRWPDYGDDATYQYFDEMYMGMYQDADLFGLCDVINQVGEERFMFDVAPYGDITSGEPSTTAPSNNATTPAPPSNETTPAPPSNETTPAPTMSNTTILTAPARGKDTGLIVGVSLAVLITLAAAGGMLFCCPPTKEDDLNIEHGTVPPLA